MERLRGNLLAGQFRQLAIHLVGIEPRLRQAHGRVKAIGRVVFGRLADLADLQLRPVGRLAVRGAELVESARGPPLAALGGPGRIVPDGKADLAPRVAKCDLAIRLAVPRGQFLLGRHQYEEIALLVMGHFAQVDDRRRRERHGRFRGRKIRVVRPARSRLAGKRRNAEDGRMGYSISPPVRFLVSCPIQGLRSDAVVDLAEFGVRWLATALAAPNRPNTQSSAFAAYGYRPSQSGGKPPHSKTSQPPAGPGAGLRSSYPNSNGGHDHRRSLPKGNGFNPLSACSCYYSLHDQATPCAAAVACWQFPLTHPDEPFALGASRRSPGRGASASRAHRRKRGSCPGLLGLSPALLVDKPTGSRRPPVPRMRWP